MPLQCKPIFYDCNFSAKKKMQVSFFVVLISFSNANIILIFFKQFKFSKIVLTRFYFC